MFLVTWHAGSSFPNQGLNPCPLQGDRGLVTALPGQSTETSLFKTGLSPDCALCVLLSSCPADRLIHTVFLDYIHMLIPDVCFL